MSLREPGTLAEYAMANAGFMGGARGLADLVNWMMARMSVGEGMTIEQWREWAAISQAQVYRRQARIRKALPGVDPERVYRYAAAEARRRSVIVEGPWAAGDARGATVSQGWLGMVPVAAVRS